MGRAEVQAGLPAPPGGIWRPCRRAQVRALWKGPSARGGGFWRGGHLGWGPPPASTRPHPLAPPGGSGDALNRKKKLSPWPGASVPAPSPPPRRSQGKQLLTSPCVLPALPASQPLGSPARPGEARSGPAARPSRLAPPLRLDLLRPPSACLRLGLRRPPARFVASFFPGGGSFWAPCSPASISWPLLGPRRARCPLPALSLRSSPSRPFLPSPGAPGLLLASGAGTVAPARARPPGPVAPDARAPRGCRLPGP